MIKHNRKSCKFCGNEFKPARSSSKYCSVNCAQEQRRVDEDKKNTFVCKHCNKTYIRRRRCGSEGKTFCSRECAFDFKFVNKEPEHCKVYFVECNYCKKMFASKRVNTTYCSKKCYETIHYISHKVTRLERERIKNNTKKQKSKCKLCGNIFYFYSSNERREIYKYCSGGCRKKISVRCARKKARELGVYYEPVNPLVVFMRDGWRCQICNKKLKPKDRGTHKDCAPEIDHIITWSDGGEHSYKNVQCACRKCNQEKGAKSFGQLRMFG